MTTRRRSPKRSSPRGVVLDIDETLIHTVVVPKPDLELEQVADYHFQMGGQQYYVFKRPGLEDFLRVIFKNFDYVGFWTTAESQYAKRILKYILSLTPRERKKFIFVYTRNRCSHDEVGYYKPLTLVWKEYPQFTPTNTIMIDNTPYVMHKNPKNGIVVPSFTLDNLYDSYLFWLGTRIDKDLKTMPALTFVKFINEKKGIKKPKR